ncbi:ankyrin repeat-containing domain protein [Trichoderma sp. SZMC 28014]
MARVPSKSRMFSGNTVGNGNVFFQGNVSVNNHAKDLQKQEEHDVLKRLYTSPYEDRKDRNPKRVPGTCDWFVSHEHFRTWNESNSSSMLWVSADPGCGKSVLVRHLVDAVIQTTESRTVCYFFFKDDFPDQKTIISALSCLLRQIFIQNPPLLSDEILKRFNSGGETFNTSFSELWKTLLQVAENKNAGEIVCLLDAIDECEDHGGQGRSKLLEALRTLYGTETRMRSNLKFLLTSRPYVGIYRNLQPLLQMSGLPLIHLSGESEDEIRKIALEINAYIDARVHNIADRLQLTQAERNLLLQKLKSVSNRTYLWVYLVLDFIENSINVNNAMIIEAISNIPTTVNEAYEAILSKSFNTEQARKALHIIVAAARPLTLKEMNFALALNKGGRQSYDELDLEPDDRFRETLRNTCGLCVVVIDSRVYLLHQTVKEFLVKADDMQPIRRDCGDLEWRFSLSLPDSHRILAEICIWHLLAGLSIVAGSSTEQNWREIFLDYSAEHWTSHFHQMPMETQSIMTESILMICDVTSSCCQAWFSSYWSTTNTKFPMGFTTLMMASYFGLNLAVSSCLTISDIKLDIQDGTYQRTALSWAARNGFYKASELLLKGVWVWEKLGPLILPFKRRAKVDVQDRYGRAPLTYAIWNGDVTLVQLLINSGAQADLRDELEGTPLSYAFCGGNAQIIDLFAKEKREVDIENDINRLLLSAAEKGHEEVMSLLLKTKRANIEARGPIGRTPLIMASRNGHNAVVELLLKAGADISTSDKNGRTALIIASWHGYNAVVELLLKAGVDINASNKLGRTALIMASWNSHNAVVELLLKAGADINASNKLGRTALIMASWHGHDAVVELLLKAGADIYASDKDSRTALIMASWYGYNIVVELLLKAGADIHTSDKDGDTALIMASWHGHDAVVKLLLKAGADIYTSNKDGRTALIMASQHGHEAIKKLLLEAGANRDHYW